MQIQKKSLLLFGAAPGLVMSGLVAEYRFDDGSGQVLTDYSGNDFHGELGSASGVDANDPTWDAEGLVFGANDGASIPSLSAASGDWTIQIAYNPADVSGANKYLMDFQTGRLVIGHMADQISTGYFDGTWHRQDGAGPTGRQITTFALSASAGGKIYRNLTQLTLTSSTYAANALNNTCSIGSDFSFTGGYVGLNNACGISYILVYSGILSDADRVNNYHVMKSVLAGRNSLWGDLP